MTGILTLEATSERSERLPRNFLFSVRTETAEAPDSSYSVAIFEG